AKCWSCIPMVCPAVGNGTNSAILPINRRVSSPPNYFPPWAEARTTPPFWSSGIPKQQVCHEPTIARALPTIPPQPVGPPLPSNRPLPSDGRGIKGEGSGEWRGVRGEGSGSGEGRGEGFAPRINQHRHAPMTKSMPDIFEQDPQEIIHQLQ